MIGGVEGAFKTELVSMGRDPTDERVLAPFRLEVPFGSTSGAFGHAYVSCMRRQEGTMDAREFFETVVKPNYYEAKSNRDDFRLIWNAIVSMNTVPEYVALERLKYIHDRQAVDDESVQIRNAHQPLSNLKTCAEALKHARKQQRTKVGLYAAPPAITVTSTAVNTSQPSTWVIGGDDLMTLLDQSLQVLMRFPELK